MASGLVVHLEVAGERHTELLTHERIRIGTREDCDLRLRPGAMPSADGDALLLELARTNGHYRVSDFHPALALTHNGAPIERGAAVGDGDRVSGAGGDEASTLTLQFFPVEAPAAMAAAGRRPEPVVAPFIAHAAIEAAATARRDDAKVFLREFTRELVREISWSTKIVTLLIAVALVGGTLYLGFAAFDELKRGRRRLEEQNAQIAQLNSQIRESQNQFAGVRQSNEDIINSLSLAPKLRSEYGNGVCLISGLYVFVEAGTNRPLRYPGTQAPAEVDPAAPPPDAEQQTTFLTPDGDGPVAEFPYVGTGFHVGGGFIVTNRHVAAEPWSADERAMVFGSSVAGRPRISKLIAYFPGRAQGYVLRVRQVSRRDDLAVAQIEPAESAGSLPTLPLEGDEAGATPVAATVGKPVVLMGYPSGPDRILASLPDDQAAEIKQRYGGSLDVLVSRLAELRVLKPLLTQGHITDLETRRIVYDARTGQGGSGAPLFGPSGRVIGVNFAVFVEIADANFAVPIRYALPLLERAGWKNPAPQADAAAAGKDDPKDAKPADAAQPR